MTIDISNNNPRISYSVAAGVTQTSFAVPFEFFDDTDLNVYVDGVLKTITTDYTVTGGSGSTGTITMTVVGATSGSTVVLTRDTTIERTTDFTAGVDINRAALNTQLDTLTAIGADVKDQAERAIRVSDLEIAPNLTLPSIANRADKLLSFDTEGAVTTQSAADLLTGSVLGANYTKASHTGDGTIVAFSTTEAAGSKNNIQVYIDGIYQNKDTFSISGSTLTFSEAPPLNSAIEFIVGNAVTSLTTDPDVVTYNQGSTGAQDRTLTNKLQETVSVKDFGAVGDGVADDTAAIQAAIDALAGTGADGDGGVVYLPTGEYKITSSVLLKDRVSLRGDGDRATYIRATTLSTTPALLSSAVSGNSINAYIDLRDFSIFGPGAGTTSDGIHFAAWASNIVGVQVKNFRYGIYLGNETSAVNIVETTIERCKIHECVDGIYPARPSSSSITDIRILNNTINACSNACMNIRNSGGYQIIANNLYNADNLIRINPIGNNTVVSSNYFGECERTPLYMVAGTSSNSTSLVIYDNVFKEANRSNEASNAYDASLITLYNGGGSGAVSYTHLTLPTNREV